jgi:hypothetical protein
MFRIAVWLLLLLGYSQAVRQPPECSDLQHKFDEWEVIIYTMALAFLCEDINRVSMRWGFCLIRAPGFLPSSFYPSHALSF